MRVQIASLVVFGSACSGAAHRDADADGYTADVDCDDEDATVHPDHSELCDGVDNDCNGEVDDDAKDMLRWYTDADGDGYAVDNTDGVEACTGPEGTSGLVGDCDDDRAESYPGASEYCNGIDDNCDGVVDDDAIGETPFYVDFDGDGYGVEGDEILGCLPPDGYAATADDCDDLNASINPGADELCNDIDDDCDTVVDEDDAKDAPFWYVDSDGDEYGDEDTAITQCAEPKDRIAVGGDCNDADASINPAASEVCDPDAVDEDCDGLVNDDDADAVGAIDYWPDTDADGFGDSDATALQQCDPPKDYVADDSDCIDTDDSVNPDADEVCLDLIDNDCSGQTDDCRLDLADGKWGGVASNDSAGIAVDGMGDLDGDGDSDIVVGAHLANTADADAGVVYVVTSTKTGSHVLSSADATISGANASDQLGRAVAGVGDIDLDGVPDLAIGADGHDGTGGSRSGAVYFLLGPISGAYDMATGADYQAKWSGEDINDFAGSAVSAAGDTNGNGRQDTLIGAWASDVGGTNSGAAYIIVGSSAGGNDLFDADRRMTGEAASDFAGYAVSTAGDVDGDGQADVLVGAPGHSSDAGAVYLVIDPMANMSLADADAVWTGEAAGDEAGGAVSGGFDATGDGVTDVLIGAPGEASAGTGAGAAYLVSADASSSDLSSASLKLEAAGSGDHAGVSVALVDLDSDGLADLVVGANTEGSSFRGSAYVVRSGATGTVSLSDYDARFRGESSNAFAGSALAAAGDADNDGFDDLLIGATGADSNGAAYLVLGAGW